MTDPVRLVSPSGQLLLEQVGQSRGTAILAGDLHALRPLVAAHDWPTDDTLAGLGAALSQAHSDADTPFLVVGADTGEVIGDCGWKSGPGPDGRAEIGYGLAPSVRGLGLGTEVVRTLTGWALAEPGCSSVVAEVLADNLPSRRALEQGGFVIDRTDGPYVWYLCSEA
ncbi:MAG TPA: GNAT family N-acetyltransferase [Candidatus Limnocylindria bacterium]|nr:GNAT family N-acetyltransferase [Candidatus Limnocylindria bacterium]